MGWREPNHAAYLIEMTTFLKERGKKVWTEKLRDRYKEIWERHYGPMMKQRKEPPTPIPPTPIEEPPTKKTPTTPY